jgi:hypothetical protein
MAGLHVAAALPVAALPTVEALLTVAAPEVSTVVAAGAVKRR